MREIQGKLAVAELAGKQVLVQYGTAYDNSGLPASKITYSIRVGLLLEDFV